MPKILGIDLGTTYSAMAFVEGGEPKIIENSEGVRTTPSIIASTRTGDRLVGLLAKRQAITNPKNTIYGVKRLMGHSFEDPAVQKDKSAVPYEITKNADGGVRVKMGDKEYRPEEISAMVLQKLKLDAEKKLGEPITEAVITVPAYFDDSQRQATKIAGEIAGFNVRRIINEPTAAALAYGFNKRKDQQVVVFDFGGGTFDVTVLDIGGADGEQSIEVKSTDGDSHMGGEDIDQKIVRWIADEYKKESGLDVTRDPLALQRLKEAAEKAKHELSSTVSAEINIPFIASDESGPKHLLLTMSRATLETIAREFVDRSIEITRRAMEASGYTVDQIDEVILVGGQTRMPLIQEEVKKMFNKEPNRSINPDEVVALGAAIQAGILQGDVKDILLLDVLPLSLGIETLGGIATKVIEKNTTIPVAKSQTFSTASDNQPSVEIHIVQGERAMAGDNKSLGRFHLDGIPPSPRGVPQIEVTFDIDVNGILQVKAKEKKTNIEQSIRIEARSSVSKDEVEKMKKDAEIYAQEDTKKRESAEIKNNADTLIHQAEKSLIEHKEKIPADIAAGIQTKIDETKKARDGGDTVALKQASENLGRELSKIGEHMMKEEPKKTEGSPASENPTDDGSGTIRDAEVK